MTQFQHWSASLQTPSSSQSAVGPRGSLFSLFIFARTEPTFLQLYSHNREGLSRISFMAVPCCGPTRWHYQLPSPNLKSCIPPFIQTPRECNYDNCMMAGRTSTAGKCVRSFYFKVASPLKKQSYMQMLLNILSFHKSENTVYCH